MDTKLKQYQLTVMVLSDATESELRTRDVYIDWCKAFPSGQEPAIYLEKVLNVEDVTPEEKPEEDSSFGEGAT